MREIQRLKIIVAGRINSGKSTFVENGSSIPVVSMIYAPYKNWRTIYENDQRSLEEERLRNFRRAAAIETGLTEVDDVLILHIHSVASNLASMSSIPRGMHGYFVLVDSTDERSFYEARALLLYMFHFPRVPYIVVANKQDLDGALPVDQIQQKMRLPDHVPMMGCVAMERDSVREVLVELLYMILPDEPK